MASTTWEMSASGLPVRAQTHRSQKSQTSAPWPALQVGLPCLPSPGAAPGQPPSGRLPGNLPTLHHKPAAFNTLLHQGLCFKVLPSISRMSFLRLLNEHTGPAW